MATLKCVKCGSPLERSEGPGRPAAYCGEMCKRLVEYELRRIDRRLSKYELQQREMKASRDPFLDAEDRVHRLRSLRAWIAQDEKRMRVLLGGGRATTTGKARSTQGAGEQ